jgi:hypothetical protein
MPDDGGDVRQSGGGGGGGTFNGFIYCRKSDGDDVAVNVSAVGRSCFM